MRAHTKGPCVCVRRLSWNGLPPGFRTHNGIAFRLAFSFAVGSTTYVVLFPPRAIATPSNPELPLPRKCTATALPCPHAVCSRPSACSPTCPNRSTRGPAWPVASTRRRGTPWEGHSCTPSRSPFFAAPCSPVWTAVLQSFSSSVYPLQSVYCLRSFSSASPWRPQWPLWLITAFVRQPLP